MKKIFSFAFVALFSLLCYSQSNFKKGKIIKNNDQVVECYINSRDWSYNPTKISYKINENDSQILEEDLTTIKSFEIFDISKYVRLQLKIDNSSNKVNDYTYNREPDYTDQTIFAKEIVFGNVSLYEYVGENYTRYIVTNGEGLVEQLIYKFYKVAEETNQASRNNDSSRPSYTENNDYRKQLGRLLKCPTLNFSALQTLRYTEDDLKSIIVKNNTCLDPNYVPTTRKGLKGDFNLNILAKANSTTYKMTDQRFGPYDLTKHFGFGAAVEIEYIFLINNNKWAIIAEGSYNQFKSQGELKLSQFNTDFVDVTYNNLDISLGLRYYLYSKTNFKLYTNISTFFNTPISNSTINRTLFVDLNLRNTRGNNYTFGVGTKIFNNFIFEARYISYSTVGLIGSESLTTEASAFSFVLGYSFF